MPVATLAVALVFGIPLLIIIGVIIICLATILRRSGREENQLSAKEAKMMQEIHASLEGMNNRIESLEAILVEANRKEEYND